MMGLIGYPVTSVAQNDVSAAPQPSASDEPLPVMRMPKRSNPEPARAQRVNSVDIPQWAKDEGHNGNVRFLVTVSPEGKPTKVTLIRSSKSSAIDAAATERAGNLTYFPATDSQGTKIEGTVTLSMGYARHDADTPGGGFGNYTCGALVLEYDWFTTMHGDGPPLFWPKNAYTSLSSVNRMIEGEKLNGADLKKARQKREVMWDALIKRCRKSPAKLMIDEVEQPDEYLRLAESF